MLDIRLVEWFVDGTLWNKALKPESLLYSVLWARRRNQNFLDVLQKGLKLQAMSTITREWHSACRSRGNWSSGWIAS